MRLNKKNKWLVAGFAIVLFISYKFAIANTIQYYIDYTEKSELISATPATPQLAAQLLQREKELDSILGGYQIKDSESFQNELLKQLTRQSSEHNLKITDFKEPHVFSDSISATISYSFTLKGSYNGTLQLLNKIENSAGYGTVRHVFFLRKLNYRSHSQELFTEVILERERGE